MEVGVLEGAGMLVPARAAWGEWLGTLGPWSKDPGCK